MDFWNLYFLKKRQELDSFLSKKYIVIIKKYFYTKPKLYEDNEENFVCKQEFSLITLENKEKMILKIWYSF